MSFVDAILGVLGFETNEKPKKKRVIKPKTHRASFVLTETNEEKPKSIIQPKVETKLENHSERKIYEIKPTSQQEVMSAIDMVRNNAKVIIDVSMFGNDKNRVLDFLSGATYCLGAKIDKLPDGRYMIYMDR